MTLPLLPLLDEIRPRLVGFPRLVMLDVDGTLAPIAPRPEDVAIPRDTQRAIAILASRPAVHVAIVSGRAASDARRVVGVGNIWVIGNHGLEVMGPEGELEIAEEAETHRGAVALAARKISSSLMHVPGVQLEDKVWTLSVHYRRADQAVVPPLLASLNAIASQHGLRLTEGKQVYELRPPVEHDKGTAVLALARRLGGQSPTASVVFVGDDQTDEDAFRALRAHIPESVTVAVIDDDGPTAAEFRVRDPAAVKRFLDYLVSDHD